jgi:hypothetical protein
MSKDPLMSFADVAREANLPLSTVYYLHRIDEGPIVTQLGRHLRVTREEFESWVVTHKKST